MKYIHDFIYRSRKDIAATKVQQHVYFGLRPKPYQLSAKWNSYIPKLSRKTSIYDVFSKVT